MILYWNCYRFLKSVLIYQGEKTVQYLEKQFKARWSAKIDQSLLHEIFLLKDTSKQVKSMLEYVSIEFTFCADKLIVVIIFAILQM